MEFKATKDLVELIMVCTIPVSLVGIFVRTTLLNKGIGARVIQFACISCLIPTIIILSIEGILKGETVATLLGGLSGYVLSGVGNYDQPAKPKENPKKINTNN